mmetsp:Transcript_33703/g.73754  ORF Transcript_33703/g.73754 Transcript_33703/m.73754 type:complete len:201 (-) Transcript_33703:72-674(-)
MLAPSGGQASDSSESSRSGASKSKRKARKGLRGGGGKLCGPPMPEGSASETRAMLSPFRSCRSLSSWPRSWPFTSMPLGERQATRKSLLASSPAAWLAMRKCSRETRQRRPSCTRVSQKSGDCLVLPTTSSRPSALRGTFRSRSGKAANLAEERPSAKVQVSRPGKASENALEIELTPRSRGSRASKVAMGAVALTTITG